MALEELFQKYGHVEVFAVEDSILKDCCEDIWEDISKTELEARIEQVGEFIPRYRAELDRGYRQIIPYCIIIYGDKIFTTRRLDGDKRLIGKLSIGIGGHIERVDSNGKNLIREALQRELDEEVEIVSNIVDIELLGHIYMDTSPVDSVHYGLAYRIRLDGSDLNVKETKTLEGYWYTKEELMVLKDDLEDWSLYCLENFI